MMVVGMSVCCSNSKDFIQNGIDVIGHTAIQMVCTRYISLPTIADVSQKSEYHGNELIPENCSGTLR